MGQVYDCGPQELFQKSLIYKPIRARGSFVADGAARWSEFVDGVITEISIAARCARISLARNRKEELGEYTSSPLEELECMQHVKSDVEKVRK